MLAFLEGPLELRIENDEAIGSGEHASTAETEQVPRARL
jgi:hypothetical protein